MSEKFDQFSKAEDSGFVDFIEKEPAPKKQRQKRCSCSDLVLIVNYIKAEQQKKASSLKIGIFTVFLVVTIITMLESVISIAPILFVNIGQQNAGAVDFKLTYTASDLVAGNNNFYTRDPFAKGNTSYQPLTASALLNRRKNLNQNIPQIYQNPDSIDVGNSYGLLNFTWYNNQLKGLSMFDGFAPRTLWPTIPLGTNTTNTTNLVLVIDCAQEQKIGLAPYFNPYILGAYQVMLSQGTMDYLNISIGDQVNFYFDTLTSPVNQTSKPFELPIKKTFATIAAATGIDTRPLSNILQQSQSELYINFTVVQSYLDSNGKFPAAYGNVALFDCNYVLDYVFQLSEAEINVQFANEPLKRKAALNLLREIEANATSQNLSFCHFGYEIDGVLNNQASYYMGKYDVIQKNIEGIAAIMQRTITLQANTTIHTPLMTQFKSTNLMQSFLQSTLITIICFLIILSGQLLYSLMLSEVDSKTYEYGMLRALGFKSSHLIGMITIQSLVFSIPGVALGLTVAYILNLFFRLVIFQLAQNSASYGLTTTSLYLGIGFGLIMPLLSILFPIKQALGKNLRQSLDLNHRSQDQTLVEVTKLEDLGMSVTQTIAGLLLVSMGFMTYYLAPLTFFLDEMVWFLFIFDVILISIVIGLTLLSIMLFEHVEKGLLTFLVATCARKDKRLQTLINKNLDSHRARNSKTSILFTLSLSFVIFSSANFKLLTGLISSEVLSLFGSDLYVSSPNGNHGDYLDQNGLQIFLTTQKSFDYSINDWSFVSVSLGDFMNAIAQNTSQSIKQSGKSGYAPLGSSLYAVPSNYLDVIDIDYYYPSSVQPNIQTNKTVNKRPNAVDLLYSSVGQFDYNTTTTDYYNITTSLSSANLSQQYNYTTEVNILLPQGIKSVFSTEVGTDATIFSFGTKNWKYLTRVRAYITKFPGLMFSGIKQLAVSSLSGVVSEPQWQQMMNDFVTQNPLHYESWYNLTQTGQNYTYNIPKYKLLISLNQNITSERKQYIMNGLRQYMTRTQYIVDVNSIIDSLGGVTQIFNLLIVVIGMISLIIVFFVLLIATTANIKENIWEYGVLRSVGLTKAEGQRIYMYEAFLVISAASILGVSIGIIVTALVTQQFYTFVELPFKLSLPYYIILILLVTALLTTYFAVLIPIRQVNKYNIAKVLKSGS